MITMDDIIVPAPDEGVVVDPATWFDTPGDVELEIGCGKGGFLLRRAQQHPDKRLIGIEWANKFFKYAADRMARWAVTNVRIMRTDADHFVKTHLPPACLTAMHVYHPDPWPKKRHHKRRLFQPEFVEAAIRVMTPNARLTIQTDHAEYYDHIRKVVLANDAFAELAVDDRESDGDDTAVKTNFAIKYLNEGRTIYNLAVVKTP